MVNNPTETNQEVKIRRAPKFIPFMAIGTGLGALLGLIIGLSVPVDQQTGKSLLGLLVVFLAGVGFGLGVLLVVILDRIFIARSKTAEATKLEG